MPLEPATIGMAAPAAAGRKSGRKRATVPSYCEGSDDDAEDDEEAYDDAAGRSSTRSSRASPPPAQALEAGMAALLTSHITSDSTQWQVGYGLDQHNARAEASLQQCMPCQQSSRPVCKGTGGHCRPETAILLHAYM